MTAQTGIGWLDWTLNQGHLQAALSGIAEREYAWWALLFAQELSGPRVPMKLRKRSMRRVLAWYRARKEAPCS